MRWLSFRCVASNLQSVDETRLHASESPTPIEDPQPRKVPALAPRPHEICGYQTLSRQTDVNSKIPAEC